MTQFWSVHVDFWFLQDCHIYLCGTKLDLIEEAIKPREVQTRTAVNYAKGQQQGFIKVHVQCTLLQGVFFCITAVLGEGERFRRKQPVRKKWGGGGCTPSPSPSPSSAPVLTWDGIVLFWISLMCYPSASYLNMFTFFFIFLGLQLLHRYMYLQYYAVWVFLPFMYIPLFLVTFCVSFVSNCLESK